MALNEDTLNEILARRDYILSGHARTRALGQFFTWSEARSIDAVALLTEAYENEDWQAAKLEVMEAYVPDSMVGWSPAASSLEDDDGAPADPRS